MTGWRWEQRRLGEGPRVAFFPMSSRPTAQRGKLFGVLVLAAATITALLLYKSQRPPETRAAAPLPKIGKVPDFLLTDQDGHSWGIGELKGKIWVGDFICTRCPGPYAVMSSHFAELDRNFSGSDILRLVSFTLDPGYDTPSVLKRYAQHYQASARWRFLTGSKKAIDELRIKGFCGKGNASGGEPVDFGTTTFALIDGDGVIRAYYDDSSVEVVQKLLTDLGSLLRASRK
jgi:protein SCO1/2